MKELVRWFYSTARKLNDLETVYRSITNVSIQPLINRVKNKWIGRNISSFWNWPFS